MKIDMPYDNLIIRYYTSIIITVNSFTVLKKYFCLIHLHVFLVEELKMKRNIFQTTIY